MPLPDLLRFNPRNRPANQASDDDRENSESRERREHRHSHLPTRRITGYHNAPDDTSPPDYGVDDLHHTASAPAVFLSPVQRTESPPDYSCSVAAECVTGMKIEKTTPFAPVDHPFWAEVYIILRGTLLEVRHVKSTGLLGPSRKNNRGQEAPGRLIRSYTLQHGEAGLASDHKKIELVPKSLAQLLGPRALRQLQQSDPSQFEIVHNYVLRLRLEGEQVLIRFKTSDERAQWLHHFCAAIDIAHPLEDRTEPKYHTLPRRRRRNATHGTHSGRNAGVTTRPIMEEQQRIIQEQFPHLASNPPQSPNPTQDGIQQSPEAEENENTNDEDNDQENDNENETRDADATDNQPAPEPDVDPEAEDLDTSFMLRSDSTTHRREPFPHQNNANIPSENDPTYNSFLNSLSFAFESPDSVGALPSSSSQKWISNIIVDPSREARYRRRCMPMLVYNSRYASNVVIRGGKRMLIDWERKAFVSCPGLPPPYKIGDSAVNVVKRIISNNEQSDAKAQAKGKIGGSTGKSPFSSVSSGEKMDGEEVTARGANGKEKSPWALRIIKLRGGPSPSGQHVRTSSQSPRQSPRAPDASTFPGEVPSVPAAKGGVQGTVLADRGRSEGGLLGGLGSRDPGSSLVANQGSNDDVIEEGEQHNMVRRTKSGHLNGITMSNPLNERALRRLGI